MLALQQLQQRIRRTRMSTKTWQGRIKTEPRGVTQGEDGQLLAGMHLAPTLQKGLGQLEVCMGHVLGPPECLCHLTNFCQFSINLPNAARQTMHKATEPRNDSSRFAGRKGALDLRNSPTIFSALVCTATSCSRSSILMPGITTFEELFLMSFLPSVQRRQEFSWAV